VELTGSASVPGPVAATLTTIVVAPDRLRSPRSAGQRRRRGNRFYSAERPGEARLVRCGVVAAAWPAATGTWGGSGGGSGAGSGTRVVPRVAHVRVWCPGRVRAARRPRGVAAMASLSAYAARLFAADHLRPARRFPLAGHTAAASCVSATRYSNI
jgi:hypothetical protein